MRATYWDARAQRRREVPPTSDAIVNRFIEMSEIIADLERRIEELESPPMDSDPTGSLQALEERVDELERAVDV